MQAVVINAKVNGFVWLHFKSFLPFPNKFEAWKSLSDISQKLNVNNPFDTKSSNSELTKTEIFAVKKQIKELRHALQLLIRP
jgi:hypothetical protein